MWVEKHQTNSFFSLALIISPFFICIGPKFGGLVGKQQIDNFLMYGLKFEEY
jgi:hypothetical protein